MKSFSKSYAGHIMAKQSKILCHWYHYFQLDVRTYWFIRYRPPYYNSTEYCRTNSRPGTVREVQI